MSIQAILNYQALKQLEETYKAIKHSDVSRRSQMEFVALREINNCHPCLDDMNETQKILLDEKILFLFIEKELLEY